MMKQGKIDIFAIRRIPLHEHVCILIYLNEKNNSESPRVGIQTSQVQDFLFV